MSYSKNLRHIIMGVSFCANTLSSCTESQIDKKVEAETERQAEAEMEKIRQGIYHVMDRYDAEQKRRKDSVRTDSIHRAKQHHWKLQ